MASNALKVEHERYSVEELEKIGDLLTTLMTQAHLASGYRSLAAQRGGEDEIGPETMQAMRFKRDIYKALGTLQEVVRAALYRKLEGMLTDI